MTTEFSRIATVQSANYSDYEIVTYTNGDHFTVLVKYNKDCLSACEDGTLCVPKKKGETVWDFGNPSFVSIEEANFYIAKLQEPRVFDSTITELVIDES